MAADGPSFRAPPRTHGGHCWRSFFGLTDRFGETTLFTFVINALSFRRDFWAFLTSS